jgi:hypothetical protein
VAPPVRLIVIAFQSGGLRGGAHVGGLHTRAAYREQPARQRDEDAQRNIDRDHRDGGGQDRDREGHPQIIGVEPEILTKRFAHTEKGVVAGENGRLRSVHLSIPLCGDPIGRGMPAVLHEPCQMLGIPVFKDGIESPAPWWRRDKAVFTNLW